MSPRPVSAAACPANVIHTCSTIHAFFQEHYRCGDLEGSVEGDDVYVRRRDQPRRGSVLINAGSRRRTGARRGVRLDSPPAIRIDVLMWVIGVAVVLAVSIILSPLVGAQQPQRIPRIGYLSLGKAAQPEAFVQRLHDLGHIEKQNITIEYLSFAKTSARLSGRRPMLSRQAKERLGDCRSEGPVEDRPEWCRCRVRVSAVREYSPRGVNVESAGRPRA